MFWTASTGVKHSHKEEEKLRAAWKRKKDEEAAALKAQEEERAAVRREEIRRTLAFASPKIKFAPIHQEVTFCRDCRGTTREFTDITQFLLESLAFSARGS